MATQLRRYDVIEGQMDSLVEWFPGSSRFSVE